MAVGRSYRIPVLSHWARCTLLPSIVIVALTATALGQEAPAAAANPLAELNAQLTRVLAAAGVPFSDEQERGLALMMDERLRASEGLFGNLLDFSDGPTRGVGCGRH